MLKKKIGIIGCGNISRAYFKGADLFQSIEIIACADLHFSAAQAKAEEYGVKACSVDELLENKDIDIVLNLTTPQAHAEVNLRALKAGKHVYCEKPFATNRLEAEEVLALAKVKGLRVGCAPDTFLGAGIQTCRKLIDDGWVGKPLSGSAFLMIRGHESWHPSPSFYYQDGGGPLMDMGPYYITALVSLLGPVKRVIGITGKAFEERVATSESAFGQKIKVEVDTHFSGVLQFCSGALINVCFSFDVPSHGHNPLELYGTEGSVLIPDPNRFGGEVKVFRMETKEWSSVPLLFHYAENSRIIGVADMVASIETGKSHRASGELAYHVLDVMLAFSSLRKEGGISEIESSCERPEPFALGILKGQTEKLP